MNAPGAVVLYLVSVVCAFILGGYVIREVEAASSGSVEHVNAMATDIADKFVATDPWLEGCISSLGSSTTLTRASNDVIKSDAAQNQHPSRSLIDVNDEVLEPIESEVTLDGFYGDELIRERVDDLIAQLDQWQIEYAIQNATGMSSDDLLEIQDLYGYASRLAAIGMSDVITETPSSMNILSEIEFTQNIADYYQGESGSTVFDSSAGRIYAVFPMDSYDGDTVLMKWYQPDQPNRVHIETLPILHGAPYNYVWTELEEWSEALYRVEIYSSQESLEPLSVGEYEVIK